MIVPTATTSRASGDNPIFDIYPEAPQLSEIVRVIAFSMTHPELFEPSGGAAW
jgi:hypothetical protein